ncbi:methyltransferase domain protein [Lyngbya aestuarii BL J]|uniref:Methyltransferase domain protein n=1 Tax=Lyngbya aestuarii BL J TaxID=1348334 RepID=U7QAJ3_9CYAN|nr:methyltransferase domain-containing protein [Lyngbya aestuarii]ERT03839.1 methyltransferase domain protein [Lyngbya aestuarii BL J]ERT04040.1 methyltransferase domain protein [Lyngbya aestuarii BL J]
MTTVICPICKGQKFGKFANRPSAKCLTCGSLERGRVIYMVLVKLGIPRAEDRILHFAPEKCFIDLFTKSHAEKYQAFDLFPERYKNSKTTVRRFDICEDLNSMPSDEWDFILHNHVLEHLFCSVKDVLHGLARILKPEGTMVFTIPIHKRQKTIENLDPFLSEIERKKTFGQKDHVRLFGYDVMYTIKESLGVNCFIPVTSLFEEEEFVKAGIPWQPENEPNGKSIFLYKKSGKF